MKNEVDFIFYTVKGAVKMFFASRLVAWYKLVAKHQNIPKI